MSSASACVRFEDGTVKWCVYHGTSDILLPGLFDSLDEAWKARDDGRSWKGTEDHDPEHVPEEAVVIYSDYGGGFWWNGVATRRYVVGPLDPYEGDMTDGTPEWVRWTPEEADRG